MALLGFAYVLLIVQIGLVVARHQKQPLYQGANTPTSSMDVACAQKMLFI